MTPARLLLAAAAVLPLLLPPGAAATPGPNPGQVQAPAAAPGHDAAQAQSPAAPPTAAASHAPVPASPAAAGPLSASRVPATLPLPPGLLRAGASASESAAPITAGSLHHSHSTAAPPATAPPGSPPAPDDLPVFCAVPAPAAAAPAGATDLPEPSTPEPAAKASQAAPVPAAAGDGAGDTRPPSPPAKAPPPHAQAKPSSTAPSDFTADADALARAYRRTGVAASVERPTEALVPFGHLRPILRCAPLRACVVVLEPGELVLSTSLGDAERWLVQAAASGAGGATPILVVKPIACDLSTNLVVATDRRIYELALDSPPCRNADSGDATYNPRLQYTGVTRFYYPDELVRRWAGEEELARAEAERASQGRTPLAPAARLAHLNFDYSWDRARRWPWVPSQVFDDGEHTYLALSPGARLADMPLLFALGPRGELTLINHHLEGQTLIADRVLERAVLVVGAASNRDAQRLEIVNRAYAVSATIGATGARR
jgi:P-type conjugative transfer protein TrbG